MKKKENSKFSIHSLLNCVLPWTFLSFFWSYTRQWFILFWKVLFSLFYSKKIENTLSLSSPTIQSHAASSCVPKEAEGGFQWKEWNFQISSHDWWFSLSQNDHAYNDRIKRRIVSREILSSLQVRGRERIWERERESEIKMKQSSVYVYIERSPKERPQLHWIKVFVPSLFWTLDFLSSPLRPLYRWLIIIPTVVFLYLF